MKFILKLKHSWIISYITVVVGGFLYGAAFKIFMYPLQIPAGGVTGISNIVNHFSGVSVGVLVLAFNIPLFALGLKFLGLRFMKRTILATIVMSLTVDLIKIPLLTKDMMLATLLSGAIGGFGLGLVVSKGATTGGSDLLAKLLKLVIPKLSFGTVLVIIDFMVITASAIAFKSIESALYGAIALFISGKIIDYVLTGLNLGRMALIISSKNDIIKDEIYNTMQRGVTLLDSHGGYSGINGHVLLCVVRPREVYTLRNIVNKVDTRAFLIFTTVSEIVGEGFEYTET